MPRSVSPFWSAGHPSGRVLPGEYSRWRLATPAGRLSTRAPGTLAIAGGNPVGQMNREAPMPALTRFVLRHKALVALLWLAVVVAGVLTVGGTTHRMTNNFSM